MSILNHSMPCKAQAAHRLGFIAMRLVPTQEFNAGLPALHYGNGPATHLGSLRSFVFKPANASSIAFWRRNSTSVTATAASSGAHPDKKQVVFLGTPEVAARVLDKLLAASKAPGSTFDIAAVVSQPGRPKGRGAKRVPQPSPVEQLALDSGIATDRIFCPEKATDKAFLETLASLSPDLCVTAAYGNYLPTKFLAVPRHGTLNIHPSLLPAYRGAAPVQRSLQDGVAVSGVTVLYTVKEMDAGPILAQQKVPIPDDVQAPELLHQLFDLGVELLVSNLEVVWAGLGEKAATEQDHAAATHAPKLTREEGELDFAQSAAACHNKVRGFAGWPGTYATFEVVAGDKAPEEVELKILRSRVGTGGAAPAGQEVEFAGGVMRIGCADGSVLEVLEVQAPGRRAVAAKDFANGMKGKTLRWLRKAKHTDHVPA